MNIILSELERKLCSYCYSPNLICEQHCYYCEAPLDVIRDFEKIVPKTDDYYTLDKVLVLNYHELNKLNPYDLLKYLAIIREEKQKYYALHQSFNKTSEYLLLARKGYLLENLLYDKTNTFPARMQKAHLENTLQNNKRMLNKRKYAIDQAKRNLHKEMEDSLLASTTQPKKH